MRSTFAGLNTMVSGIHMNRLSLETVGHNITNATTDGYSRQNVNRVASASQTVYTQYGAAQVGTGTTAMAISRARDIYADHQYWKENATSGYFQYGATNLNKIESIFNDSKNNGVQNALEKFYSAWVDCSTTASTSTSRQNVINQGQILSERLANANTQLKNQITGIYDDLSLNITEINSITDQLVDLNESIMRTEAAGGEANDLCDQRDLLVDKLSGLMEVNVYEDAKGMYTVVSNGTSLVNGISKLTLELSMGIPNAEYGITDFNIQIKETGGMFDAGSGELQGQLDAVETSKRYMDTISDMAAFMLTSINEQHRAGAGIDEDTTTGINFYGEDGYHYTWDSANGRLQKTKCDVTATYDDGSIYVNGVQTTPPTTPNNAHTLKSIKYQDSTNPADTTYLKGVQILDELKVNTKLTADETGQTYLATRALAYDDPLNSGNVINNLLRPNTTGTVVYNIAANGINGTGDGTSAVNVSTLINCELKNSSEAGNVAGTDRPIGTVSLYSFYNTEMTTMGATAEDYNNNVEFQKDVIDQIYNLRQATSGVNWDEELSNMIMFQQGYQACSRCLNAMDEMLDKLVNSTGMVGR
ncbi:MAG: flagellar hook-associated protein FlgK [Selenomonadaceae bacterium]|nr:flagellar hook-associated protein FlgK [Selenomonadaceae bacterium]